uniref:Uncharacterized protein n=1 Tax=Glossina palpalis gambiensis TaxID=67801 RepID=A0A1B0BYB5_9MUSC
MALRCALRFGPSSARNALYSIMFSALNATGKQHQSKLQQTKLCLAPLYECLFAFITKVNPAFYAVAVEANASTFNFE